MKYTALLLLLAATTAGAITHPDTPDDVRQFHQRIQALKDRVNRHADTTLAMGQASKQLAHALDGEVDAAYRKLMRRLPPEGRTALRDSQRRWLKYRDAEFAFIGGTYTRERYGSSASLTAGTLRNAIVYARAETLWSYLAEL